MQSPSETGDSRSVAVDIDLQCALAFGRTALKAISALSEQAAVEVERGLVEELAGIAMDARPDAAAIQAVLTETRDRLKHRHGAAARLREAEERLLEAARGAKRSEG